MSTRRSLSTRDRVKVFGQGKGVCYLCKQTILPREPWECEHPTPFAVGGSDRLEDLLPVHVSCHATKTKRDVYEIAKTNRIQAKHIGAHRSQSRPMPGTKRSGWRHLMNGKWERRT